MSDERNARKVYQGRVVSDKMDKTITVVIDTYKSAPILILTYRRKEDTNRDSTRKSVEGRR